MKISKWAAWAVGICLSLSTLVSNASPVTLTEVSYYCRKAEMWATFGITPARQDLGRPGAIYVGAHTDNAAAYMAHEDQWFYYRGEAAVPALFPTLSMGQKVFDFKIYSSELAGWNLYVGYGVLTEKDDKNLRVQEANYENMKAQLAASGRKITPPDFQMLRQLLVQSDMTKSGKYQQVAVLYAPAEASNFCRPCVEPYSQFWSSVELKRCVHPTVVF